MRINVATDNEVKVRAVAAAFRRLFPGAGAGVIAVPGPGPGQPIGEGIGEGAILRARTAARIDDPDFAVGIEAGLIRFPGTSGWYAIQGCAVIDRAGKSSLGWGPAFAVPKEIVAPILAGEEMREVIRRIYRLSDEALRRGLIDHLSCGRIDRTELTEQAVLMALLPWREG